MIFDLDGTPPDIGFPDTALAETDPNGLLAIGGDLSRARVLGAYRRGIFPWYSPGQPILWWSPAPRMVLFPDEFHCSRSLRRSLRNRGYQVSINLAFEDVIRACAEPRRPHEGTWLLPEMIESYVALNLAGHAHSIEVWLDNDLVGGLYGIAIGQIFFGESMFSRRTDASKVALSRLTEIALGHPFQLIDCQIHTEHLASLGAREVGRETFQQALDRAVALPAAELGRQPARPAADIRWAA
ncbi:MAG: leucyl/phenylalanyl-tRNA--protein transferase [Gammaproteobacteria bacterium]|nr:leucyl/phenylalanyl-tRNA--protein transferase [Gammaproteobacteria bacterium]